MGLYSYKPLSQKFLIPTSKLLIKLKIHPTLINIAAIVIAITGALALYYSQKQILLLWYIPIMAFLRISLNVLDGMVARGMKVKNQKFGEIMNEFPDRISDSLIFGSLIFVPYISTELAAITLILILLSAFIGVANKSAGGRRIFSGLGKPDRMLLISIAAILIALTSYLQIMNYILIIISIGTALTIIQRFYLSKKELYK